ncbi:MAG: hypothetical protein KA792_08190 [Bacteroidales bacterium]|nr:hypothetical protein [Bacteroidales bacterium]
MERKAFYFLLFITCLLLFQCRPTKIITERNLNADIYINGIKKGKKEIKIHRYGIPKKIKISAKYDGEIIGNITEKRRLNLGSFILGYFTYGTGFIISWSYPKTIIIPVNLPPGLELSSPWDTPYKSVWMKPVNHNSKFK